MKNETFKGAVITGICTIIAAVVAGSGHTTVHKESIGQNNGTIISGNNNLYIEGDVDAGNTVYSIELSNMSEKDKLNIAIEACMEDEFDRAYNIYKECEAQIALLNLGYIYANGLSYVGKNIEKAEDAYIQADCVEAKRGLLILYIENGMMQKAQDICKELMWVLDDSVTWDYILNCIYEQSWEEYQKEHDIAKLDFLFDFNLMYEWEYIDNYYRGYNPPSDTERTRWIFQGVDFDVSNGNNHPYIIYREQIRRYTNGIDSMASLYYEEGTQLVPFYE